MGYIAHHAIIVTGSQWGKENILTAHELALRIFDNSACCVTPLFKSGVNGYQTFMVTPDGSKEGWEESDQCDVLRSNFFDELALHPDMWVDAVLVRYGGDEPYHANIVATNYSEDEEEDLSPALNVSKTTGTVALSQEALGDLMHFDENITDVEKTLATEQLKKFIDKHSLSLFTQEYPSGIFVTKSQTEGTNSINVAVTMPPEIPDDLEIVIKPSSQKHLDWK